MVGSRDFIRSYPLQIAIVFVGYFVAGKFGLSVPFTDWNVSPVWPPAGIALASVLLFGLRVWPGIALSAFCVNFFSPIPHLAAFGIAFGNTSSAVLAGYLLRRIPGFDWKLGRLLDIIAVGCFGSLLGAAVAASIGTTTLYVSGLRPWTQFSSSWLMWWAGDGIGVLLFAPLILTIFGNEKYIGRRKPVSEIVVLAFCTSLACVLLFEDRFFSRTVNDVLAFTLFPFVMWSAIRFGLLGTSLLSSAIAMATVWETARGHGPFVESSHLANAALLQVFLAVISVTGMVLAAVVRERETAEELLTREQELIRERDHAEAALLRNEKLIATSRLAATMAHEINNPLAAVTNLLYLIGKETDLSERSRHYLELAEDELQRVAHSARRTLGFYREVATPERLDLSQLLDEVVEVFKKQISEKQIRIARKFYAVTVSCNRGEIFQVFSNLIANAIDASFKGGTLQLRVCRQRVSHAEIVRVCVADNGSGIARQHHENIFQPFFTTKKDLGTGLGMWLSHSIVMKHSGSIRFRSSVTPGRSGTVFVVRLPLK